MARAAKSSTARRKSAPSARSRSPVTRETPLLEWIAAGVGLILILAVLGVIGAEVLPGGRSEPSFEVRALAVQPVDGGYRVRIAVHNRGDKPAGEVVVAGVLAGPDNERETAEATFDFVADHSRREGGLFFRSDPGRGALDLRATSYVDP